MFEVFSGHNQALNVRLQDSSVAGTFISRNTFAGYLLMVIPLGTGFVLSRERVGRMRFGGWRNRLSSLDGKTILLGFGVIVMILGLIFSASRMGILSLLLSFTFCAFLFRDPGEGRRISRVPIVVLGLALLWAAWIGLDAVIGRFLATSEDFGSRWAVWADTYKIVRDFPLFGSGLGTFWQVFPMYRSFNILTLTEHAENDFLQLASETGLAGIGLLLILFSSFFYKALSGVRSLSWRDPQRYTGMGGLVGILALMFHSLVEKNFLIPGNTFLFAVILALVLHVGSRTKESVS
jgi:O-antigen ligase